MRRAPFFNMTTMKNRAHILFLLLAVVLGLASCGEKIKTCSGKVAKMTDTTMVTTMGDYAITFDIKKAQYTNGAIMDGDSVLIHYVGDLKERKAVAAIVKLIPKKGHVVEAVYDPSKELEVSDRPMTKEEERHLEGFVKKYRK